MYSLRWGFAGPQWRRKQPLASVVLPPSTIAKQCTKRNASTQASDWSLWLPSTLIWAWKWMYTRTGNTNRGAKPQSADRQSSRWQRPCEGTLFVRAWSQGTVWTWKDVFASQCNVRVVTFFLRSWQRRRRSEIGCYSARRGAAFHCIAWEVFEYWRKKNNRSEYEFGNFSSWSGSDWSP